MNKTLNEISLEGEVWRDIPGYDGMYMASNFGRIYSLPKQIKAGFNLQATINRGDKILKSFKNKKGYLSIDIRFKGKRKYEKVHRLVAYAFFWKIRPID